AESVNLTLARPATTAQVRAALAGFPGVRVLDDRAANSFPTPLKATGCDEVLVGRIRPDPGQMGRQPNARPSASGENSTGAPSGDEVPTRGFDLFLCGDQLRKGAALNAVQIAELLVLGAAGRAPSPS
ncbi:MAG TPA: Asd/ArgC dimerization domain-containing protein, partial [Phycisphaerales bacterium]|nr:Asd/ArgC dimerization domain-containing protein [Phycisphaerales bacterium]